GPVRRFGPQRAALAALFRQLAAYARAPSDPGEAPPATAEATAASTALAGLDRGHGNAEEGLRTLLDEAERIRLELLALADVRDLLRTQGNDEAAVRWIDELLDAASEVLAALATGRPPVGTTLPLRRIEAASRSVVPAHRSARPTHG